MTYLAWRDPLICAKENFNTVKGLCYYTIGRCAYDPNTLEIPQINNAPAVICDAITVVNEWKKAIHSHYLDTIMEKAATGDDGGQPSLKDVLNGLPTLLTSRLNRFVPYANQIIKNQLTSKNGIVATGSVVALLGLGAFIISTTSREDFENAVRQTTYDMAMTANKIEDTLSAKIEKSHLPAYTPNKINV
jgi:hypothetical protein